MSIEAMKQALGALENAEAEGNCEYGATSLLRIAIAEAEKQEPLTDEDWEQLWAEFDSSGIENDFQDHMVSKYGAGHYTDADMYWQFQQQVIKQMVNAVLKEKNNGQR